jgi:hypothetical protein
VRGAPGAYFDVRCLTTVPITNYDHAELRLSAEQELIMHNPIDVVCEDWGEWDWGRVMKQGLELSTRHFCRSSRSLPTHPLITARRHHLLPIQLSRSSARLQLLWEPIPVWHHKCPPVTHGR